MNSAAVIPIRTTATSEFEISQIGRGRLLLDSFAKLHWLPEAGIGWYPVEANPYNAEYWDKYRALDSTASGDALTACRVSLVRSHWRGPVVDVGIGGGRFVQDHHDAFGFDINPSAVAWLKGRKRYCDPHSNSIEAATFWDSLEHIHDPAPILENVRRFVFVSLPIFDDVAHVLRSKHFKPAEHCWYFTRTGFDRFMRRFGFRMVDHSTIEQSAGREDIESFAFERVREVNE
jgi:Methyltransferase domain